MGRMLDDDTDPRAEEALIAMLRAATPERRFALACSLTNSVRSLCRAAISQAHPEWDARRQSIEFVRVQYGDDLAARVDAALAARGP